MAATARILALAAAALALTAAPAVAVPDCSPMPAARTLASGQGVLESVAADARGRLFISDLGAGRILRLDGRKATPRVLTSGIDAPGGLVLDGAGRLVAGFGDSAAAGQADDGRAGLERIDTDTGERRLITRGLGMANGVARGPDGSYYATNDFAGDVDRIRRGGVEADWAKLESSNGLAVDTANRFLYVDQTFADAAIKRVDLAAPGRVRTYFSAPAADANAFLDGMARDGANRLYVAANGAGEVWRIDRDRSACALVRGLSNPSSVSFGGGGAFPTRNLYVVAFSGVIVELADVTTDPPAAPALGRLRIGASPRRVGAGARASIAFTVTRPAVGGRRAAVGATVRFAGAQVRTDEGGRAVVAHRFRSAGLRRARVSIRGLRGASTLVRITR